MNKDQRITEEGRFWYIENTYDPGRAIPIYEAIKDLGIESILDIACGEGLVLETLSWVMPIRMEQFDIVSYPEWGKLKVKPKVMDLKNLNDEKYDLVMMLNSYRNWEDSDREKLNDWLKRNAKYLITSYEGENHISDNWSTIGQDVKGHSLKLYTL